jgi:hypothetical protein
MIQAWRGGQRHLTTRFAGFVGFDQVDSTTVRRD